MSATLFALTRDGAPADFAALLPLKRFDKGIGKDDPFAAQRLIPWQGESRMAIGQVTWQGSLRHEHFPHTELLVVHSGVLVLETDAKTLTIRAGESVVIPQGNALSIRAAAPACWSFCTVSGANSGAVQPVQQIDYETSLKPSSPPSAEVLLSSEPKCRSGGLFDDNDNRVRVGIWDSTPYTRKQVPHRLNELMFLLEGSVTLTDATGTAHVFNQGDVLFVPKGTPCAWHSSVIVKKLYWVQEV